MSCEIAAQSNKNDCAMLDKNVLNIQRSADSGTFPSVETIVPGPNAQRHGMAMALYLRECA
ncbi:hypothetical protein ASA01S_025_00300 [Aeromonas salmonicida subsp. masoucida NBRC 13784]|nr:hypothetical protein ASA01S_025_00300 [Aeromonas salmonicida subsp. masoucida NBRC 13784]